MKTYPLVIAALLGPLFLAACDDEESGPSVPPDLRLEDVVGCWYWSKENVCETQCYDANGFESNQMVDSMTRRVREDVGKFEVESFYIIESIEKMTDNSGHYSAEPFVSKCGFRRVGEDLYALDYEFQLKDRYSPVNLDSAFPCGTPFMLLPKPEGWSLF